MAVGDAGGAAPAGTTASAVSSDAELAASEAVVAAAARATAASFVADGVDAVIVPGGGLVLDPASGAPVASPWVVSRLHEAARLYHAEQRRRAAVAASSPSGGASLPPPPCLIVVLSIGTPHKPMPRHPETPPAGSSAREAARAGFQVTEAEASAAVLVRALGVPPEHVLEESTSLDTIGNAYFLRATHTE